VRNGFWRKKEKEVNKEDNNGSRKRGSEDIRLVGDDNVADTTSSPVKPVSKAGRTRRTLRAYLKTEYSAWSSRFFSTAPVFPHSPSPISPTPYQQTTVGPTRQPPHFLIHPPPPLSTSVSPRCLALSAPPSPSSWRGPAGRPPLPAATPPPSFLPSPASRGPAPPLPAAGRLELAPTSGGGAVEEGLLSLSPGGGSGDGGGRLLLAPTSGAGLRAGAGLWWRSA
jgi:hypothetical protein